MGEVVGLYGQWKDGPPRCCGRDCLKPATNQLELISDDGRELIIRKWFCDDHFPKYESQ